jgi:hypothetical protein
MKSKKYKNMEKREKEKFEAQKIQSRRLGMMVRTCNTSYLGD